MSINTLAASRAIKKAIATAARDEVVPGNYDVDFHLHVVGDLTVGESYDQKPTSSMPYKLCFAALCHFAGCTGKAGINKIRQAMQVALDIDNDIADNEERAAETRVAIAALAPDIAVIEREVINPMLADLPKQPCRGRVTVNLTTTFAE